MGLEQDFHHAMVDIFETEKGSGYYASYFKLMLDQYGGAEAAKRLLAAPKAQQGLFRLWELDHLANSVEAHVVRPEYQPLFTEAEIEEARRRLKQLGYTADD
ncbi:MAG: hypothetical protein A2139_06465 [Desulfobacca sp. RBG_16_60_12]|nr:MAG: hypothetical protein A2139_06465 [Desulfobacca sp. RBG_16_60_12]